MRKIILGIVASAALAAPVALAAAPAQANPGSPNCVTRAEYRAVHKGMTKAQVDRRFGIHGHRQAGATSGGFRSEIWSYKTCQRFSAVAISYSGRVHHALTLDAKSAVWAY